jgi:hypothetical protein
MKITWYSGGLKPDLHPALPQGYSYGSRASMFVGSKGIIINDGGNRKPQVFPESFRNTIKAPKPSIKRSPGHFQEWIDAIRIMIRLLPTLNMDQDLLKLRSWECSL